jgi:hypothetical protein
MMIYNFGTMLWENLHLGLYDVFNALAGGLTMQTADEKTLKKVYWEYCRIARYGREIHYNGGIPKDHLKLLLPFSKFPRKFS